MTDPHTIARSLSGAQIAYIKVVAASDVPYEPRHGRTANWALRHKITETVIRMQDGREGAWADFSGEEVFNSRVIDILGNRLTPLGQSVLAIIEKEGI